MMAKHCLLFNFFSRALAEQSPYYESFKKRNFEVLFCYEPYDELVLMQLGQYNSRFLTSVEKELRQDNEASKEDDFRECARVQSIGQLAREIAQQ